jgi:hypothetical protein
MPAHQGAGSISAPVGSSKVRWMSLEALLRRLSEPSSPRTAENNANPLRAMRGRTNAYRCKSSNTKSFKEVNDHVERE